MTQPYLSVVDRVMRAIRIAILAVIAITVAAYSPFLVGYVGPGTQPATLLPSGVRLVLGFAPDSGLVGNLTRDTLIAP